MQIKDLAVGDEFQYFGKPAVVESVQKDTVVIKIKNNNGFGFRRIPHEVIDESYLLGNSISNRLGSDVAFQGE